MENNLMDTTKDISLFQQIGQIQGTLTALNSNITDFKSEFRTMTNSQNDKIELLRKDLQAEIKDVASKVETLEEFKANLEGAREEAKKNARKTGATAGGTVGLSVVALGEAIKFLIAHIKF